MKYLIEDPGPAYGLEGGPILLQILIHPSLFHKVQNFPYILSPTHGTHQQGIFSVHHDQVFEAEQNTKPLGTVDHIALGVQSHQFTPVHIVLIIFGPDLHHRSPASQIVPAKICRYHEDIVGLFHDPIVDGNTFQMRIDAGDFRVESGGTEQRQVRPRARSRAMASTG